MIYTCDQCICTWSHISEHSKDFTTTKLSINMFDYGQSHHKNVDEDDLLYLLELMTAYIKISEKNPDKFWDIIN